MQVPWQTVYVANGARGRGPAARANPFLGSETAADQGQSGSIVLAWFYLKLFNYSHVMQTSLPHKHYQSLFAV